MATNGGGRWRKIDGWLRRIAGWVKHALVVVLAVGAVLAVVIFLVLRHRNGMQPVGKPDYSASALELAQTYAPVLYRSKQVNSCDNLIDTDPYLPTDVGVFWGKPNVVMSNGTRRQEAVGWISGGSNQFLDVVDPSPSNPDDLCTYTEYYRKAGGTPTVYANVKSKKGNTAVQYYFFYYLDDWVNVHEGDWEVIQLLFPSGSSAEINNRHIAPEWADYSLHTDVRTRPWSKVEKDNITHPLVYVAAGSHANYFEPGSWRWQVVGLPKVPGGCDFAVRPGDQRGRRLTARDPEFALQYGEYSLVLLQDAEEHKEFGWTTFQGKWGQASSLPWGSGIRFPLLGDAGRDPWWWHEHEAKDGRSAPDPCVEREGGVQRVVSGHQSLQKGQTIDRVVTIQHGDLVTFRTTTEDDSHVSLKLSGPELPAGGGPDATVHPEHKSTYEYYELEHAPGTWTMHITSEDGGMVAWEVFDQPPLCSHVNKGNKDDDADADGISNYEEEVTLKTDPCKWDSRIAGIPDGCFDLVPNCPTPIGVTDLGPTPTPTR